MPRSETSASGSSAPRHTPNDHGFRARVVSTQDDLLRALMVRSLVFLADQECPYEEEFDGNDYAGLHVLAEYGNEPVGTLRLRFFADFAKLERVAVRKDYRRMVNARQMITYGLGLCRRKGYTLVLGYAQIRLLRFWRMMGFEERTQRARFVFSDHEYAEILCRLEAHPQALTLDSDPLVMIRPEGNWDRPGVLDQSVMRPAHNPDADGGRPGRV